MYTKCKKARFSEQPFPLFELPRLVIDQIWDQLCENDDMDEKFYLALYFIRPDFDITNQPEEFFGPEYESFLNSVRLNRYEKHILEYHFGMSWPLLRVAVDEEHRRELGLILPEKLTDSLQDYLLNGFREANPYEYLKDQFEEIHEIGSDHSPEDCHECKFVRENNHHRREFLCCEKYYASINLKLLKFLQKEMTSGNYTDGSYDYRIAAHEMLSNIVFDMEIWDPYLPDFLFPRNHVEFVLDLLKPLDEKIEKKLKNKEVTQQTNITGSIKEFPEFQKISRRRTNSCNF